MQSKRSVRRRRPIPSLLRGLWAEVAASLRRDYGDGARGARRPELGRDTVGGCSRRGAHRHRGSRRGRAPRSGVRRGRVGLRRRASGRRRGRRSPRRARRRFRVRRRPAAAARRTGGRLVAALVLLVVWTGATVVWSIGPDRSWETFNRGLAYVAFLGLGVVLAGVGGVLAARVGAALLALVTGAVLVWALATKVVPVARPGCRADRPAAGAGRVLECARAARGRRRRARALARRGRRHGVSRCASSARSSRTSPSSRCC